MTAKKQKQPRKITRQYLENAALYYLQRYASSVENFRRVMHGKIKRSCDFHKTVPGDFYPMIDELVKRYVASGLLNDKGFAEAQVSSLRRQGRSKNAIIARLHSKGLGRDNIETALEIHDEVYEGKDAELEAAKKMIQRKRLNQTDAPDIRKKNLAKLGRAGFSYETAKAALNYIEED